MVSNLDQLCETILPAAAVAGKKRLSLYASEMKTVVFINWFL